MAYSLPEFQIFEVNGDSTSTGHTWTTVHDQAS